MKVVSIVSGFIQGNGPRQFGSGEMNQFKAQVKSAVMNELLDINPTYCLTSVSEDMGLWSTAVCKSLDIPYVVTYPRIYTLKEEQNSKRRYYINNAVAITDPGNSDITHVLRNQIIKEYVEIQKELKKGTKLRKYPGNSYRVQWFAIRNAHMINRSNYVILVFPKENSPLKVWTERYSLRQLKLEKIVKVEVDVTSAHPNISWLNPSMCR